MAATAAPEKAAEWRRLREEHADVPGSCPRLSPVSLALCLAGALAAQAQSDYPNRQIRLLVGFAAGGPVDVTARITADALSAELGKTLVVDNRVGAGGNLAADMVAKAPPDGYTLLQSSNALAISPGIYAKLPFDVLKDFDADQRSHHHRSW